MSYTPINWQTGDTITAEKMNKMDNGWSVTTSMTTLFEESGTSSSRGEAILTYSEIISADVLYVTFNGTDYTCPVTEANEVYYYGAFDGSNYDWTTYPFFLRSRDTGNMLVLSEGSEQYTIKVAVQSETVETSKAFDKARGYWTDVTSEELFEETVTTVSADPFVSASLSYSGIINQDTVVVTFNGTDYVCNRIDAFGEYFYGGFTEQGPDFSDYPFALESNSEGMNNIYTQTAGTYTVKAVAEAKNFHASDDFATTVQIVAGIDAINEALPFQCLSGITTYTSAFEALQSGRLVYFCAPVDTFDGTPKSLFIISRVDSLCTIVPDSDKIEARFGVDSGIFFVKYL